MIFELYRLLLSLLQAIYYTKLLRSIHPFFLHQTVYSSIHMSLEQRQLIKAIDLSFKYTELQKILSILLRICNQNFLQVIVNFLFISLDRSFCDFSISCYFLCKVSYSVSTKFHNFELLWIMPSLHITHVKNHFEIYSERCILYEGWSLCNNSSGNKYWI